MNLGKSRTVSIISFYYPPISEHALEMEQVIQREPPPVHTKESTKNGLLEEFKSDHLTNLPIEQPSNNEIETPEQPMEVDLKVDRMTCKSLLPPPTFTHFSTPPQPSRRVLCLAWPQL